MRALFDRLFRNPSGRHWTLAQCGLANAMAFGVTYAADEPSIILAYSTSIFLCTLTADLALSVLWAWLESLEKEGL